MIELQNMHKYLSGQHVLRGIDLKIESGEIFVIVGPSGTGKSVLLRHMIGLHTADEGKILVDGQDVGSLSDSKLEKMRSRFGVLFQSGALLNWMSVLDNVALPLREKTRMKNVEIEKKANDALKLIGLENDGMKMPSDISGGMRKRAGLARAIVTEPEIVLYDEPTSGLDPIMSRKIDNLIVSLKNKLNVTSVVVTHDLASAFGIADRIAMMNNGRIVMCGSVKEFKASGNDYVREFIAAQKSVG